MARGVDQVPTIASAAELLAVGEAIERAAAGRYGEIAATLAAAGNAEVADLFRRLEADKLRHGDAIARRAVELGLRPMPVAMARQAGWGPVPLLADMADEDPYTVTAYRACAVAVRHEQRAFAFYAYVAAHAPDQEVRLLAEGLAHEQLERAAVLRRERRKAWRRTPSGIGHRPPPPSPPPRSLDELKALATSFEAAMAAHHGALAEAAAALGDAASAAVLGSVAAQAAAWLSVDDRPPPVAAERGAARPAATGSFDLLRACLVDLEAAYEQYMRAAEGRAGEDAMLEAQRLAASAMRRSSMVRGRLAALGTVARP